MKHNYKVMRNYAGKSEVAAVVKGNGYGCGIMVASAILYGAGCRTFFVATPDEGKMLRQIIPDGTIYVLEGLQENEIDFFHENMLRPVLNNLQMVHTAIDSALPCALHFDTGMNRLGLSSDDFMKLATSPRVIENLDIQLVMSHFACADTPEHPLNAEQGKRFAQIASFFKTIAPLSLANSAGLLLLENTKLDMVRSGIALYGGMEHTELKTVLSMKGKILQIRKIKASESVGYGAEYVADSNKTIIAVSGGYADGIPRCLATSPYKAFYKNYYIKILGRVSMDTTIFDATHIPENELKLYSEVEFLGENVPLTHFAKYAGTIPYEVLTGLSHRAEREIIGLE